MDMNIKNIDNFGELFTEWKKSQLNDRLYDKLQQYCSNLKQDAFACDGIVDDAMYSNCDFHVLYVMSESNADEYVKRVENQSEWDLNNEFRRFSDKGEDWPSRLKTKICEMQRIILKTETGIDVGIREAAKTIAVMNLNKRGGGKSISNKYLLEYFEPYVEKHQDFIKREVEIINPDLIICCGNVPFDLMKKYGLTKVYKDKAIHMWHPSYTQIPKGRVESENCISKSITIRRYIGKFEEKYRDFKMNQ
ncbi:MAG: hypothetical protein PHE51_11005 [Eubacteriales bacterium]|nr:hypothetical protein [Eubacteriales bacterium]